MNLWSKIAATLVVVAGLCAGQTAPANSPSPAPVRPAGSPATSPPSTGVPEITVIGPKATVLEPTEPEVKEPRPIQPAPQATPSPRQTSAPPSQTKPSASGSGSQETAKAPNASQKGSVAKPAADASGTAPVAATADVARYILGPNDVVKVDVWGDKNLSNVYSIGPDGLMSMQLVNEFKATGLTLLELKDLITGKIGDYIKEPIVSVQLLRNNSKKYTMVGGVGRTGPFPLTQETTVLDALAAAGGFRDFANQKKIYLLRGTKQYPFNYKDVIHGKHMEQNILIEDGDIINVPE